MALPGDLLTSLRSPLLFGSATGLLALLLVSRLFGPRKLNLRGKHVLIPGGSMGIGEQCAILAAQEGASVSLLARGVDKLRSVKAAVDRATGGQCNVFIATADVVSLESTKSAVEKVIAANGPVDVLLICVGYGVSGAFEDMPVSEMEKLMRVNWLGPVHLVKAVLPSMKATKGPSCICFCSSQAAQIGVYGYSAYSAAKRALVGFAEILQQEVARHNVRVSVCYPPDTDTPGLAEENKTKPELTKVISSTGSVFTSQDVAQKIISGIKNGDFNIRIGFDGWMLGQLNATSLPQPYLHKLIIEAIFAGPFRIVAWGLKLSWQWTVNTWHKKHQKQR